MLSISRLSHLFICFKLGKINKHYDSKRQTKHNPVLQNYGDKNSLSNAFKTLCSVYECYIVKLSCRLAVEYSIKDPSSMTSRKHQKLAFIT